MLDDMADLYPMDVDEFIENGYLQEINRRILHPLGLALATSEDLDGEKLLAVVDGRDDPEGIYFEPSPDADKAKVFREIWRDRRGPRLKALGYVVQPVVVERPKRVRPRSNVELSPLGRRGRVDVVPD